MRPRPFSEIVAYIDRVGRLRCVACCSLEHQREPVYQSEPRSLDRCDVCGKVCDAAAREWRESRSGRSVE